MKNAHKYEDTLGATKALLLNLLGFGMSLLLSSLT